MVRPVGCSTGYEFADPAKIIVDGGRTSDEIAFGYRNTVSGVNGNGVHPDVTSRLDGVTFEGQPVDRIDPIFDCSDTSFECGDPTHPLTELGIGGVALELATTADHEMFEDDSRFGEPISVTTAFGRVKDIAGLRHHCDELWGYPRILRGSRHNRGRKARTRK